jgi:hypothetical protein
MKDQVENNPEVPKDESSSLENDTPKVPSLFHNYLSLVGFVIVITSLTSIVLLFLLELTSAAEQPYLGVLIYVLLPGVMLFGLAVVLAGVIWERRRRRRLTPEEIAAYPILDLNGPRRRRAFFIFLFCSFVFLMMSAFGSYRAFEYTESVEFCGQLCHSVMNPEFVAYNAAPHSKIRCVECHVGSGAQNYLRAKFNGVHQLYAVTFKTYSKPIQTPVHNMRPANETCGKCHWTEKYYGEQLKVFNHYGYDENNSLNQTRMLIKVGGGSPETGKADGIHWHMNLGNELTFISADEKRQNVQWVRMKDADGKTVEYFARNVFLSPEEIEKSAKRKMDCIDCHNRPTHIYLSPNQAVDQSIDAKRLDPSLPYLKLKAVEVLSGSYSDTQEALNAIATNFPGYYQSTYPELYNQRKAVIDSVVIELQRIYQTYFFPEMKTDWQSHVNNIGHRNSIGCFRCHNGEMTSKEGKVISKDCAICHVTLDQTFSGKTFAPAGGKFQHPLNLGDMGAYQCAACHQGNRAFQHPLKLGDISRFQCAECHTGQTYKIK